MENMEKLVAILFLSREVSHRLHLKTDTYAHHMALNEFYDGILDLLDELTEVYQGKYGILEDIPYLTWNKDFSSNKTENDIKSITYLRDMFNKQKMKTIKEEDRDLQNISDEICALYNKTIYKLTNLK